MYLLTELLILAIFCYLKVVTPASIHNKDDSSTVNFKMPAYGSQEFTNLNTKDKINVLIDLLEKHITMYHEESIRRKYKPIVTINDNVSTQDDMTKSKEKSEDPVESISDISDTKSTYKLDNVPASNKPIEFNEVDITDKSIEDYISSATSNSAEFNTFDTPGPEIDSPNYDKPILEAPKLVNLVTTESFKSTHHLPSLDSMVTSTEKINLTTETESDSKIDLHQSSGDNVQRRAGTIADEFNPINKPNFIESTSSTELVADFVTDNIYTETNNILESTVQELESPFNILRDQTQKSLKTTEMNKPVTEPYLLETNTPTTMIPSNLAANVEKYVINISTELTPQTQEKMFNDTVENNSFSRTEITTPFTENSVILKTEHNDQNGVSEPFNQTPGNVSRVSSDNNLSDLILTTPTIVITELNQPEIITLSAENAEEKFKTTDKTNDVIEITDKINDVIETTDETKYVNETNDITETTDETNHVIETTNETNYVIETTNETNYVIETNYVSKINDVIEIADKINNDIETTDDNKPMTTSTDKDELQSENKRIEEVLNLSDKNTSHITMMQLDSLKNNFTSWVLPTDQSHNKSMSEHKLLGIIIMVFS